MSDKASTNFIRVKIPLSIFSFSLVSYALVRVIKVIFTMTSLSCLPCCLAIQISDVYAGFLADRWGKRKSGEGDGQMSLRKQIRKN